MVACCGYSLIEILCVSALIGIAAAFAVPQSLAAIDRARAAAAARYLASRMAMARSHAVMRSAHVALRFNAGAGASGSAITFQMFVDGNRNGVRTSDIATGTDTPVEDPVNLSDLFPGAAIGLVAGVGGTDPVQIGSTNLLSFTPVGTSTSGSVYVRGRDDSQFVVRVLGATGRVRGQRYVPSTRTWVDGF